MVVLLVAVVSAALLGIGTALTYVFSVSVWEATVVVMVVAAGAFWLHFFLGPGAYVDEPLEELLEEAEPRLVVTDLPLRPGRKGRRRRR